MYLNKNITQTEIELKDAVKQSAANVQGIGVDLSSIIVLKLTNYTAGDAILVLTQYGFFKEGLDGLDLETLGIIGDNIGKLYGSINSNMKLTCFALCKWCKVPIFISA